ncbi:MAG TPA: dienelactone hydrolase family protein [Caulobacteraceae bacterium]
MASTMRFDAPEGEFTGYAAWPEGKPRAAVVVIQEIFGVNAAMREVCDELASWCGYLAVCPDLFWRLEPGVDITDQTQAEWDRALDLMGRFDVDRGVEDIALVIAQLRREGPGKVGAVGYCLGGKLAYLTAARTDSDASVGYYPVGLDALVLEAGKIERPLMLHVAEEDGFSTREGRARFIAALEPRPSVTVHTYPGRDHAFARPGGKHFHQGDAALANERTAGFFREHLG